MLLSGNIQLVFIAILRSTKLWICEKEIIDFLFVSLPMLLILQRYILDNTWDKALLGAIIFGNNLCSRNASVYSMVGKEGE